jgi:cyclophilin family peptidyl-prolyl cis-trans isomerase
MDLCSQYFYDSLTIYSIVPKGLISCGLPEKEKESNQLESNFPQNTIKAEINPKLVHKIGAVGMFRLPNDKNPEKLSDAGLFFLVDGMKIDEKTMNTLTAKRNAPIIADYITIYLKEPANKYLKDSLESLKIQNKTEDWKKLYIELTEQVKPRIAADKIELFEISPYQRKIYTGIGGIPIYDGEFTVFGEIVFGIEILDKLSKQKTIINNAPKKNIYILSTKIISKKEFEKKLKE